MIFRIALSKLEIPLTEKKLKQKFSQADLDKDDLLGFNEFMKSLKDIKDDMYVGKKFVEFRKAFCKSDENNNGLISENQFRLLLSSNKK